MELSQHDNLQILDFLVSNRADVNLPDDQGETPLFYAIRCEQKLNLKTIGFLIKQGANLDHTNKHSVD